MNSEVLEFVVAGDSSELRALVSSVRKFSAASFHLPAGKSPEFRREDFDGLAELGLGGMSVSETLGGSQLSSLEVATVIFEIAKVQLGPAIYLSVHSMVAKLISQFASNDQLRQRAKLLGAGKTFGAFCLTEAEAGSDAAHLKTRAERLDSGYRLSGEKIYITSGGHADEYLVFARSGDEGSKGISAFVVAANTKGLSFGPPEKKMGAEGSPISSVHLDDCVVPAEALLGDINQGYKIALSGLAGGRVNISAAACGIAARALELAAGHLETRKQFGKALQEFQGLQFMIADLITIYRASVLLTREAATASDRPGDQGLSAAISKCFATDAAMKITTDAVQLFGGAGYLADYEVERLMRDAKMLQIVEGTNQIQRVLIARGFLNPPRK